MSGALAYFNQKLYYASVLLKALRRAIDTGDAAEQVLLQAYGQSIQGHLQDAYGYLLLALSDADASLTAPPGNLAELIAAQPSVDQQRGELQELQRLERDSDSWLARVLDTPHHRVVVVAPGQLLASSAPDHWSLPDLQDSYDHLLETGERMGDSLDEW